MWADGVASAKGPNGGSGTGERGREAGARSPAPRHTASDSARPRPSAEIRTSSPIDSQLISMNDPP